MRRAAPLAVGTLLAALCAAGPWGPAHAAAPGPPAPAAAAPAPETAPAGEAARDGEDESEAPPSEEPAFADGVPVDDGLVVGTADGRTLLFRARLEENEDEATLARRVCGDAAAAVGLRALARGSGPRTVEVPWDLVRPEYRYVALRAVFPRDRYRAGAWEHDPAQSELPLPGAGAWQVALWFTGDGENFRALGAPGPARRGAAAVLKIPEKLLLAPFRPVADGPAGLTYGEDERGAFAEYRLARGEAIYSAVITRFTDMTRPDDVNAAAQAVRARSGIRDVRRIEVGQRVRVPFDMLATRFLPENHPRRVLQRLHEAELVAVVEPVRAVALEGVHVLLDPGHGGEDAGARGGRIWESDYVYDVACRVQRLLEKDTSARVRLLVRDTQYGCRVFDRTVLPRNAREVVDSKTPLPIRALNNRLAVNRRWMLANEIFAELTAKEGVAPDKVVFLSLHADSLHRSMRGATVYVPGERYRQRVPAGENDRGALLAVSRADRVRDEALSRRLAVALLDGYRQQKLPVLDELPVRDHVVRGPGRRRDWLPAVLRGNLVPAKVLLETVNIGNPDDARILADPAGRERIARAVVAGLERFYSGDAPGTQLARAAAGAAASPATPPASAAPQSTAAAPAAPAPRPRPARGSGARPPRPAGPPAP